MTSALKGGEAAAPADASLEALRVTQIVTSRFHHFHLARQLERHGVLKRIFSAYPRFKLRDEDGIAPKKIKSFPVFHGLFLAWRCLGRERGKFEEHLDLLSKLALDAYASMGLGDSNALIALSTCGLKSGAKIQRNGGVYICDRGSTHMACQERLMQAEYRRWGLELPPFDRRFVDREIAEYHQSDRITVPSTFVKNSFVEEGIDESKIAVIPYGARVGRFKPVGEPDPNRFTVLFVGQVSLRKGFLDLVSAFERFSHPKKRLVVIGAVAEQLRQLLRGRSLEGIEFLGPVSNAVLAEYYSSANVMVLPSIEEGLSMVIGEALACGCPVIATHNTGAANLMSNGEEGFILPIHSPELIAQKITELASDASLRERFRHNALRRVQSLGGWDTYGDQFLALLRSLVPTGGDIR